MGTDDTTLRDFVASRYPDLRRSAFLMCGDWARADEQTRTSLAHLVDEAHRTEVEDPDAYVYAHLMSAFQHRPGKREHLGQNVRLDAVLVLDALHKLTPRCRAVLVLRHVAGFEPEETADVLGLTDERVGAYEEAGIAALEKLLSEAVES